MLNRTSWNVIGPLTLLAALLCCRVLTAQAAGDHPLADTAWRLVQFQSMNDAIGTVRPQDPSLYTLHLHGDGSVTMRLNCNRARGTWSAEPSADGNSGRFEFGPLAATRMRCPPPSMDEEILLHARYVRTYLLQDSRLYLSLMADGGIYAWEPIPGEAFSRTLAAGPKDGCRATGK